MTIVRVNSIVTTEDKPLLENSGSVIAVTSYKNGVRTVLGDSADAILWSVGTFNKKISNSKLILMGNLPFRGGRGYFTGEWWRVGASGKRYDGIVQQGYNSDTNDRSVQFGWSIVAEYDSSEIGLLQVDIGWTTRNGLSQRPADTWNPSFTDDVRSQQKESTLIIFEVVK